MARAGETVEEFRLPAPGLTGYHFHIAPGGLQAASWGRMQEQRIGLGMRCGTWPRET